MTKDEAFREYQETIEKISAEFEHAKATAKELLNIRLASIRAKLHKELQEIRDIQQRKGR